MGVDQTPSVDMIRTYFLSRDDTIQAKLKKFKNTTDREHHEYAIQIRARIP